jgi:hypothetical protein
MDDSGVCLASSVAGPSSPMIKVAEAMSGSDKYWNGFRVRRS